MAREFGPSGFGEISLAASLISYALALANCGTGIHAVRVVAMGQSTLETMIPIVVTLRVILGSLVFALLLLAVYSIPKLFESRQLILLFGLTLFTNAISLMWVPQAIHRTNSMAVATVMLQLLNLSALFLFLSVSTSLHVAPLAVVVAEVLVALGLLATIRTYVGKLTPLPAPRTLLSTLRESAPIGMTQLVRAFALASDLLIVGLLLPWTEVGMYAASFKIFLFMLSLGSVYFVILLPRLAELSESDTSMAKELRDSFIRVLPLLFAATLGTWILADFMINILFGSDYDRSGTILRILSIAVVANIVGKHYRQVLLVKKMQNKDLETSGVSAVVHIAAKLALVPFFGIVGCAVGALIGELVLMVRQRAAVKKLKLKQLAI